MESHVDQPFYIKENIIYDFGIPRITLREQQRLINDAIDTSAHHAPKILENYRLYEENGKIKPNMRNNILENTVMGYCKSNDCIESTINRNLIIRSANFNKNVCYNCADCLAKYIYKAREKEIGPQVLIEFPVSPNSGRIYKQDPFTVSFQFIDEKIEIKLNNKTLKDAYFEKINKDDYSFDVDHYMIFKLVVKDLFTFEDNLLSGFYEGKLLGRHVCANIYNGKRCYSFNTNYLNDNPISKTVPLGVVFWKEKVVKNSKKNGDIICTMFCRECEIMNCKKKKNLHGTIEQPFQEIASDLESNSSLENHISDFEQPRNDQPHIHNEVLDIVSQLLSFQIKYDAQIIEKDKKINELTSEVNRLTTEISRLKIENAKRNIDKKNRNINSNWRQPNNRSVNSSRTSET